MVPKKSLKQVSSEELREKWQETADSGELGFHVGVAGEAINDIRMPRWELVRHADGPKDVAVYEDEFGNYFAVADDDGPYASLIRLNGPTPNCPAFMRGDFLGPLVQVPVVRLDIATS